MLVETVIAPLKNISKIQHTCHRSPANDLVNILAGQTALSPPIQKAFAAPAPGEIQHMDLLAEAQRRVASPKLKLNTYCGIETLKRQLQGIPPRWLIFKHKYATSMRTRQVTHPLGFLAPDFRLHQFSPKIRHN